MTTRNPVLFTEMRDRVRLTEELHKELLGETSGKPGGLLLTYADLPDITSCVLL